MIVGEKYWKRIIFRGIKQSLSLDVAKIDSFYFSWIQFDWQFLRDSNSRRKKKSLVRWSRIKICKKYIYRIVFLLLVIIRKGVVRWNLDKLHWSRRKSFYAGVYPFSCTAFSYTHFLIQRPLTVFHSWRPSIQRNPVTVFSVPWTTRKQWAMHFSD